MAPEAFFLPAEHGQRFCLYYAARWRREGRAIRGAVLYVHPFAEEMNKTRHMAAQQARALAAAGFDVLQMDLLGCGDSSGDFGDASWQDWVSDVVQACHWLRSQPTPHNNAARPPALWLWGLRAGCLLAVAAASQLKESWDFLFWQPPRAGKALLQQFLRLKVAADLLDGQGTGAMETLRQQLADGASLEVGGYRLSSALASGLEQALLVPPAGRAAPRRVEWFELSTREDAMVSPGSSKAIAQWQQAGVALNSHVARGPAFWQTSELENAPALITASTTALSRPNP